MRTELGPDGDLYITPLEDAHGEDGCVYTVLAYLTDPPRCVMRTDCDPDADEPIRWSVMVHPTSGYCLEIEGRLWQHARHIEEDEALKLASTGRPPTPPFLHFL